MYAVELRRWLVPYGRQAKAYGVWIYTWSVPEENETNYYEWLAVASNYGLGVQINGDTMDALARRGLNPLTLIYRFKNSSLPRLSTGLRGS